MWYANSKQFGKILTEIKNSSNIFTFIGPFMFITCLETNFFFLERYPASKKLRLVLKALLFTMKIIPP